jgi:protein associated with RNAse G/E
MFTRDVTITKLDYAGQPRASYPGEVVFRDEQMVVVRCTWTRAGVFDLGAFALEQGDIFVEYYYRAEGFNIFKVYSASGILKGWYCNLTATAEIADGQIRWRDLELDLLMTPDGREILADEPEFEARHPSATLRAQVMAGLVTLRRWRSEGRPPLDRVHCLA